MKRSNPLKKNSLSVPKGGAIELSELDRMLDVPAERFAETVDRLVKSMRQKGATVAVRRPMHVAGSAKLAVTVRGSRQYQRELQKLPQMDRAEEFRMARRYEFAKARSRAALKAAGFDTDELDRLVTRPRSELLAQVPSKAKPAARAHLESCLAELEELRNLYVEGGLYMVLSLVHRYSNLGVDTADLIQEGNASLFQAIEGFDWRREVRFRTYAQYWVQQAILKLLYDTSRTVRVPVWVQKVLRKMQKVEEAAGRSLTVEELGEALDMPAERVDELRRVRRRSVSIDATYGGDEDGVTMADGLTYDDQESVPESVEEGDLVAALGGLIDELPEREAMILRRRYGIGGREPETLGEIAADLGITAERVRQLQGAALKRLQKPSARERLAIFD